MGTAHTPAGGAKEVCPTCPCHCPASQGVSPKENIPGLSGTDPDIGWSPGQSRQRNEAKDVWGALGLHIGWELSLSLGLSGQGARLRGVMGTTHHVDLGQTDPGARWIQAEADVEPHARVQSSERNTWMACCWGAARAEAGGKRGQSGSLEMLPKSGGMSARVQVSPGLLEDCFQNNLQQEGKIQAELGSFVRDHTAPPDLKYLLHYIRFFKRDITYGSLFFTPVKKNNRRSRRGAVVNESD